MIIRFFKGVLPSNLFLIIFIAIVSWLPIYFINLTVNQEFTFQYLSNVFEWLNIHWSYSTATIIISLVVVQAMYVIQVNHKHILIEQRSYLPALIFTLLYIFFIKSPIIIPLLLSNLLWFACIDILFSNSGYVINVKAMFNIGLLIAMGTLFHWFVVFLIPLVWILSFTTNGFNLRGLLVSAIGFLTFWLLFSYYLFLFDDIRLFFNELLIKIKIKEPPFNINLNYWLPQAIGSLLMIISFFSTLFTLRNRKIIARKFFATFFLTVVYVVIIVIVSIHASTDFLCFLIIPLTYTTTEYLLQSKSKWIPSIMFTSFIISITLFWVVELTGFLK